MKKANKLIVATGLLAVTILGIFGIIEMKNITLLKSNVNSHVQAYNHNPNNIIDNVFEKNGTTILPFILKNSDETISTSFVKNEFTKAGQNITSIPTNEIITTGTTIKTNTKNYNVVIYGDVDGDGYVDVFDAQAILRHYVFAGNYELKGLYSIAANVDNEDEEVDVFDAQRILRFYVGNEPKLVLNEPVSTKEADSIAPTVTLTKNSVTTNSIKVTANAKDEQSGMPENPTYTFYIKKSGEADSKYVKKQSGTKATFELSGLTQNLSYTVKVETKDNLGNVGSKTLTVKTAVVSSAKDSITFGDIIWDSSTHKASVNISTDTNYTIKYQKNSTTGTWVAGTKVTGLSLNDTLYACLSDGTNNGTYTSLKITDKTAPTIKLNGDSQITLIVKNEYTEQGATATDNVDGNITNNITTTIKMKPENGEEVNVNSVNTSIPGTYTITYSVTDTAGNTSSTTRKVIINDIIDNIEISTVPNKVVYNYGENIELTGTKIKVNYLSGKSEDNIDISNASVSEYNSKAEGQQEIFVTYKEKQTSFIVTVLKKINGLEITETGRNNVTVEQESDVYKTISKEQFVLGTIKEIDQEEGSKLVASQVQFTVKMKEESSNSNTSEFIETDKLTVSINENNEIIGTAQEAGSYQIEAYIMYEEEKVSITIDLNATKSTKVGELIFTGPEDNEVRYNNEEPVQKELKVKNVNGEEIGILAKDVIITNSNSDKITITKLNEFKSEISQENEADKEIRYLEITTNSKIAEEVSFKIEIANTNISKDIIFDLGEALGITSIKVTKVQEDGETEVETTSVALGNEIGETILPIYFYNQLDNQMEVKAMDVQVVNNQWLQNNSKEDGKLYIVIPDVQIQKMIGSTPVTTQGTGITAKLYDENGIEATANDNVAKIGFSLLNNEEQKVILSSLADKNIEFVSTGLNEAYKLSMEVSYNSVTTLNFSDTVKENIEVSDDDSYNYIIEQGSEFILGSISVPVNEEITADMLEATAQLLTGDATGINLSFEDKADGSVLVKGTANKIGSYEININLKDNANIAIDPIYVKVEEPTNTTITDIQIGQDYVIGNNVTTTTISALSNNSQLQIKRKDIEIKHKDSNTEITNKTIVIEEPENVEILLLNDNEEPLLTAEGHEDEIVSKISIEYTGTVTENTSKTINVILYNNDTPITKTLKIYASDVKAIDIASEVALYKTANAETVTYNGLNYSLIEITGYLDENKTIETDLKLSTFQGEDATITVTPEDVLAQIIESVPASEIDVVDVKYFDSSKTAIDNAEQEEKVKYIGFAIKGQRIFNAEDLDGAEITVTCTTMQNPITITINYTEN